MAGDRILSRSVGPAHIIRHADGTASGVWGIMVLRSAFQPIFAFGDDGKLSVVAFEGLLRPERDGESISPTSFLADVPPADRMHVETLARTLHLINAGTFLDPHGSLFINFDPSLFSDRELIETVLRDMRLVLHETGIAPGRIVCEVTEQPTSSSHALYNFVQTLRGNGFRIAIDDYGAEDSGIQRINDLKPDIVKFDAHWIARLMNTKPGNALLAAMVAEFRAKGILNLFEGIEEPWQLELAEQCGVDMVQGYVLARPELVPTSFAAFGTVAMPVAPGHEAAPAAGSDGPAPGKPNGRPSRPFFGKRG